MGDGTACGLGSAVDIGSGKKRFGNWEDGALHGLASLYMECDKITTTGLFDKGFPHGIAFEDYPDGRWNLGDFVDGEFVGQGVIRYADLDLYVGAVKDSKPDGFGMLVSPEWTIHVIAEWKAGRVEKDKITPFKAYSSQQGGSYEGEFGDKGPEGLGVQLDKDGGRQIGRFVKGKINGYGVYVGPLAQSIYVGEWDDDEEVPLGFGVEIKKDTGTYVGQWVEGRKKGGAILHMANGEKYCGEFEDGKFDGKGMFMNKNYKIRRMGLWEDGEEV